MTFSNNAKSKGAALYIALMATMVILGIALGLASLLLGQARTMRGMGNSVIAFFAADAGIERILLIDAKECALDARQDACVQEKARLLGTVEVSNGAFYQVTVERGGEGACAAGSMYCAQAFGSYMDARRSIRITR